MLAVQTALLPRKRIIECSVAWAAGKTIDIGGFQIPKTFRLIDCKAYCEDHIIRVIEWDSFDITEYLQYATISYIWQGNHKPPIVHSFAITGAENGDRIDLGVLRITCSAAIRQGLDYIWLDRLCITQTSVEDTNWQVMKMAAIYERCSMCLVLPGGIGGLVGVDDTTSWINRSWTLQEALLPKSVYCIVKWTRGTGWLSTSTFHAFIDVYDDSITIGLVQFLHLCLNGVLKFYPASRVDQDYNAIQPQNLSFAKFFSDTLEAQLALNNVLGHDNGPERDCTIWRCALMRAATHDIDVVYSIMGLFGVQLDPSRYTNRSEALTALLQELMRSSKGATWLAASVISPGIIPNLPTPANSNQRRVLIRAQNGDLIDAHTATDGITWYLDGAPIGTIDDFNIVKFTAPFSPVEIRHVERGGTYHGFTYNTVIEVPGHTAEKALLAGRPGVFAVVLGQISLYTTAAIERYLFIDDTLLMLLEPVPRGDVWCKTGMAAVPLEFTKGWESKEVMLDLKQVKQGDSGMGISNSG